MPDTATQPATTLQPTRLKEAYLSEGNLIENPIFRLSNKEARPTRAGGLVDPADYVIEHVLDVDGVARRKLVVRADVHSGFPTMFAYRVLLSVLQRARELGWPQRVPITRPHIRRDLKMKKGGSALKYIDEALSAMRGVTLVFVETWWDAATSSHPGMREEALIKSFQFRAEGRAKATSVRQQELALLDEYVELGDGLLASCKAGYFLGIDVEYLNDLPTDTSQRLYAYLTKRDGGEAVTYSEDLAKLARKFPLARTKPSYVREKLEPALEVLSRPLPPTGRQFLSGFSFADGRLTVEFYRPRQSCKAAMAQHLHKPTP